MKTTLVFYPNYGSGIGSCLISFSIYLEIAKYLNINFAIDWSNRAQLNDKELCIFCKFFDYPKKINNTEILYGNNINNKYTKKGKIISYNDIFEINNKKLIYTIRDSCPINVLKSKFNDAEDLIKKNLNKLFFKFNDENKIILNKFLKNDYCSIHLRTGNKEFSFNTPFWKRDSILKKNFKFLLLYKIKKFIEKYDKKYNNLSKRYIFTDSYILSNYFINKKFSCIQKNDLTEQIHYKKNFQNTNEALLFYEQSLLEIKIISMSKLIIWDGSGFAQSAILLSRTSKEVSIKKILGKFIYIDYAYRLLILLRRFFTRRSLLNITK